MNRHTPIYPGAMTPAQLTRRAFDAIGIALTAFVLTAIILTIFIVFN